MPRPATTVRPLVRWAAVVAIGLALGVATALADASVGFPPDDRVRAAVIVLNLATTWATVAFLAGRVVGRRLSAAVAGAVALWSAVTGYYGYGAAFGDRTDVAWSALVAAAGVWLLLALVVGPLFGALGAASRRPGRAGPVVAMPLAVLAVAEVFGRIGWSPRELTHDPVLGWTLLGIVLVAGLTFVALAAVAVRRSGAA